MKVKRLEIEKLEKTTTEYVYIYIEHGVEQFVELSDVSEIQVEHRPFRYRWHYPYLLRVGEVPTPLKRRPAGEFPDLPFKEKVEKILTDKDKKIVFAKAKCQTDEHYEHWRQFGSIWRLGR